MIAMVHFDYKCNTATYCYWLVVVIAVQSLQISTGRSCMYTVGCIPTLDWPDTALYIVVCPISSEKCTCYFKLHRTSSTQLWIELPLGV